MTAQPTLTDGVITLRPWRDDDVDAAVAGHDEEIAHWFGFPAVRPSPEQHLAAIGRWRTGFESHQVASFVVEEGGEVSGSVEVRRLDSHTGELSWVVYAGHRGHNLAAKAVRILIDWALSAQPLGGWGLSRVEAKVEPDNRPSMRVATRSGMLREGTRRVVAGTGDRAETTSYVIFARLSDDPPLSDPSSFRALLNSFLPRKRAITQMLIRDTSGRVLLCQLTYKRDWDLPGGVVEVFESPREAASREVAEELSIEVPTGTLLLTDWLPAWSGWDDAVCLIWDGGVHDPSLIDPAVLEEREIAGVHWCGPEEIREHCADFTARRIEAALARVTGSGPAYTESGRP